MEDYAVNHQNQDPPPPQKKKYFWKLPLVRVFIRGGIWQDGAYFFFYCILKLLEIFNNRQLTNHRWTKILKSDFKHFNFNSASLLVVDKQWNDWIRRTRCDYRQQVKGRACPPLATVSQWKQSERTDCVDLTEIKSDKYCILYPVKDR